MASAVEHLVVAGNPRDRQAHTHAPICEPLTRHTSSFVEPFELERPKIVRFTWVWATISAIIASKLDGSGYARTGGLDHLATS